MLGFCCACGPSSSLGASIGVEAVVGFITAKYSGLLFSFYAANVAPACHLPMDKTAICADERIKRSGFCVGRTLIRPRWSFYVSISSPKVPKTDPDHEVHQVAAPWSCKTTTWSFAT
jgi:hypothetical protein